MFADDGEEVSMKKRLIDRTRSSGPLMTEVEPRVLLSADLPGGLVDADAMPAGVAPLSDPSVVAGIQQWSDTDIFDRLDGKK